MSSVFHMFQDRQIAVDEEPYSQLEWTDNSQSEEESVEESKKAEKKKGKTADKEDEQPVM